MIASAAALPAAMGGNDITKAAVNTEHQDDFTTPDRSKLHTGTGEPSTSPSLSSSNNHGAHHHSEEKKDDSEKGGHCHPKPATVTPAESSSSTKMGHRDHGEDDDDEEDSKHVRFNQIAAVAAAAAAGGGTDSSPSAESPSKRGLVSRRGGRQGATSPGRALSSVSPVNTEAADAAAAVLEFKTYRSPERNSQGVVAAATTAPASKKEDVNDSVPSLRSTVSMKDEEEDAERQNQQQPLLNTENNRSKHNNGGVGGDLPKTTMLQPKKSSGSYAMSSNKSDSKNDRHSVPAPASRDAGKANKSAVPGISVGGPKKSNVTFSPVPPPKESMDHRRMKTPVRSPTGGRFTSLPNLDDAAMASPGIFLSPNTPTRLDRRTKDSSTLLAASALAGVATKAPLTPKSPRTPRRDTDRFLATPTEFAFDYFGGKYNSESSNVLAWLQSPTSNGLFSPGGLGSMLNTPKGGIPRTPRTPTISTSFFFSDVAGLPRGSEFSPTKHGAGDNNGNNCGNSNTNGKRGGSDRESASGNSTICISPLASSKAKSGQAGHSPKIDYKDMFASPAERSGLAMLGVTPTKGLLKARSTSSVQKGANLDAVHLAERELMEDEDLSVLLNLASNTPRPASADRPVAVSTSDGGTGVFRSPESHNGGCNENLPTLHLPMIGGKGGDVNSAKLTRKTHSRDYNESPSGDQQPRPTLHTSASSVAARTSSEDSRKDVARPSHTGSMHPAPHPYSIASHYPHHEASYYPPMHPGMSHGGSMRVVVGGPHPSRGSKSPAPGSPRGMRPYSRGPQGEYPPPYGHYPPRHGGPPPPHMHPHYNPYPPPPHHVAPRHSLPTYSGANAAAVSSPAKKPLKPAKPGAKRPAPVTTPKALPPAKKAKKVSSPPGSTPKKKNRSPQLVDKADRQKAAAAIHSVNAASGGKNDKAAALAAAILRGVTMRPSGKWQAQLYFAGKSRYIGVFDTREKAALAYEIARERLKSEKNAEGGALTPKQTEAAVNGARKAAFEGVNEQDPSISRAA